MSGITTGPCGCTDTCSSQLRESTPVFGTKEGRNMKLVRRFTLWGLALSCLCMLAGCGGDGGSEDDTASGPVDVTGNWAATAIIVPTVTNPMGLWHFTQSGSTVTGTFEEEHGHYGDLVDGSIQGNVLFFKYRYLCHNGNPHGFEPDWCVRCTVNGNTMRGYYKPVDSPQGVNEITLIMERQ